MTRPSTPRFYIVLAGTILLTGVLMHLAGLLAAEGLLYWEIALSVLAAFITYFPFVAVGEWIWHRYGYHRPWRIGFMNHIHTLHHVHHHWRCYPPAEYVRDGDVDYISVLPTHAYRICQSPLERATAYSAQYFLYLVPMATILILPGWLISGNPAFTFTLIILHIIMSHIFVRVHDYMHQPAGRWMERRFWFKFLNRHHYIHHVDTECNVNFLLPLGDLLFGTLRTQLSESELSRWPSFEEATHRVFPNLRRDPKLAGVEAGVSHTTIG